MNSSVTKIIDKYHHDKGQLVSILQDIQAEHHYLPKDILIEVSQILGIPLTQEISRENKHYVLIISLPFATKEQISLTQSGDELVIQLGIVRRNISLPHVLMGLVVKEAKFEQGKLKIRFEEREIKV